MFIFCCLVFYTPLWHRARSIIFKLNCCLYVCAEDVINSCTKYYYYYMDQLAVNLIHCKYQIKNISIEKKHVLCVFSPTKQASNDVGHMCDVVIHLKMNENRMSVVRFLFSYFPLLRFKCVSNFNG